MVFSQSEGVSCYLHSGEERQVEETRDAHQWLVYQDGVHRLFNAVLGIQRWKEYFHFLPNSGTQEHL